MRCVALDCVRNSLLVCVCAGEREREESRYSHFVGRISVAERALSVIYIHMYTRGGGKRPYKTFWPVTFIQTYDHGYVHKRWRAKHTNYGVCGVWEKYRTVCMHMYITQFLGPKFILNIHILFLTASYIR